MTPEIPVEERCLGLFCDGGPQPYVAPAVALRAGYPALASAAVGARVVLAGRETHGKEIGREAHSLVVTLEPGIALGAVAVGYDFLVWSNVPWVGVRAELAAGTRWRDELLLGPRIQAQLLFVSLRGGAWTDRRGAWWPEASAGIGF